MLPFATGIDNYVHARYPRRIDELEHRVRELEARIERLKANSTEM